MLLTVKAYFRNIHLLRYNVVESYMLFKFLYFRSLKDLCFESLVPANFIPELCTHKYRTFEIHRNDRLRLTFINWSYVTLRNCRALLYCMHRLNRADRTQMRKNLDNIFTNKLGLNLGIFKMKITFDIAPKSQSRCFPKNIHIFKGFVFYISAFQHFRKKIIKCVLMCRAFTIPYKL